MEAINSINDKKKESQKVKSEKAPTSTERNKASETVSEVESSSSECETLLMSLEGLHHGLTPEERKLVYLFALEAGLRWGGITKLKVSDIDLKNRKITIRPAIEKARRGAELPLSSNLVRILSEYLSTSIRLPNCKLIENTWMDKGAQILREDLEHVNIEYITHEGNVNFHALRHTFCTNLAKSGVTPQLA